MKKQQMRSRLTLSKNSSNRDYRNWGRVCFLMASSLVFAEWALGEEKDLLCQVVNFTGNGW